MTRHFETANINGCTYRAAFEGEGPVVLMVHGFPESWYSWRHQMPAIADAGFKAVAVDVLGYGGSIAHGRRNPEARHRKFLYPPSVHEQRVRYPKSARHPQHNRQAPEAEQGPGTG